MKTLLTGAAGFLGSHALRHLLVNTDDTIVCPVSMRHKGRPKRMELAMDGLYEKAGRGWRKRVEIVWCDLRTIDPMTADLLRNCGRVINYASESHVDRSIADPAPFMRNNFEIMVSMLELARTMPNLQSFVHISTDEVYGDCPEGAHAEWSRIRPSNPYSASKAAQEAMAYSYWRTYGVPIAFLNCMNLIGETQDAEKFVPTIMRKILAGEVIDVHTANGVMGSRMYLHARNLADAALWLSDRPTDQHDIEPRRFNVVGDRHSTNIQMVADIARAMGSGGVEVRAIESPRPGHDARYALDGSAIARAGWKAPISFDDSVSRLVRWTMDHQEWLR